MLINKQVKNYTLATLALSLVAGLLSLNTATAQADTSIGQNVTVTNNSTETVNIPIPSGTTPTALTGNISGPTTTNAADVLAPGSVKILSGSTVIFEGSPGTAINTKLPTLTTLNDILPLTIAYNVPTLKTNFCATQQQQIDLTDLKVTLSGNEVLPTTVANFFSSNVTTVIVTAPKGVGNNINAAALQTVASVQARLGQSAKVKFIYDFDTASLPTQQNVRVIKLVPGDGPTTAKVNVENNVSVLTLTGSPDSLKTAANSLSSPQLAIAANDTVTELSYKDQLQTNFTLSLQDLGAQTLNLSGWGSASSFVGVSQTDFNGPVQNVVVNLKGTHTAAVEGAVVTVTTYWNDNVIGSTQLLPGSPSFNVSLPVPDSQIRPSNGLKILLASVPPNGVCTGPLKNIPMELSLDTSLSNVSAARGETILPGFDRFPQAFGNVLNTWFPTGVEQNMVAASYMVAALQNVNTKPFIVNIEDYSQSAQDQVAATLVVGANLETSNTLGAPLRLTQFRTLSTPNLDFSAGSDKSYAALEAFVNDNTNFLMLGTWVPPESQVSTVMLEENLARYVYENPSGWRKLFADVLIVQQGAEPVNISSNSVIPQPEKTSEYKSVVVWYLLLIMLLIAAALIGAWYRSRKAKQRIEHYVDAQEEHDEQTS